MLIQKASTHGISRQAFLTAIQPPCLITAKKLLLQKIYIPKQLPEKHKPCYRPDGAFALWNFDVRCKKADTVSQTKKN